MEEGYSHELSSCGFWPGGGEEGAIYAYAYPEPDGFSGYPVGPGEAFCSTDSGLFLLPYEAVRTAADPDRALLEFLHTCTRRQPTSETGTAPRSKPTQAGGTGGGERADGRGAIMTD
jgi:hypothetical protein